MQSLDDRVVDLGCLHEVKLHLMNGVVLGFIKEGAEVKETFNNCKSTYCRVGTGYRKEGAGAAD
jgi:hypothetical protein